MAGTATAAVLTGFGLWSNWGGFSSKSYSTDELLVWCVCLAAVLGVTGASIEALYPSTVEDKDG
jgi:hypothetical protein